MASYVEHGDTVLDVGCGKGILSLALAELVGPEGTLITADLQPQMLTGLQERAERAGLFERIQLQQSAAEQIGDSEPADFTPRNNA